MDRFDYQHLDGLTLEPRYGAIRIDYSEPDQGGTRLLIRFRIYVDGRIERDSGYAHDSELRTEAIDRSKLPSRVIDDGLTWVQEQIKTGANNTKLIEALHRIEEAIRK